MNSILNLLGSKYNIPLYFLFVIIFLFRYIPIVLELYKRNSKNRFLLERDTLTIKLNDKETKSFKVGDISKIHIIKEAEQSNFFKNPVNPKTLLVISLRDSSVIEIDIKLDTKDLVYIRKTINDCLKINPTINTETISGFLSGQPLYKSNLPFILILFVLFTILSFLAWYVASNFF